MKLTKLLSTLAALGNVALAQRLNCPGDIETRWNHFTQQLAKLSETEASAVNLALEVCHG